MTTRGTQLWAVGVFPLISNIVAISALTFCSALAETVLLAEAFFTLFVAVLIVIPAIESITSPVTWRDPQQVRRDA